MASPYKRRYYRSISAVAAGSDLEVAAAEMPGTGTVAVRFIPDTVLTGANTDSRTLQAFNRGQDGSGSTKIAELAYVSGVNVAAMDSGTVTATATNTCVRDDVISFKSLHVGSTGLASPSGLVVVEFTPS